MHPCLRAHAKQARKCAGAVWTSLLNHKFDTIQTLHALRKAA